MPPSGALFAQTVLHGVDSTALARMRGGEPLDFRGALFPVTGPAQVVPGEFVIELEVALPRRRAGAAADGGAGQSCYFPILASAAC